MTGPTAGLLLAAGAGTRFGGPKALVEFAGEPLVWHGIRLLRAGGCDPVVVVVGADAERVAELCADVDVVVARDWATGMGASLRAGLAFLQQDSCVVALVDQPLVAPEAVRRLREAPGPAAVACYDGHPRNPVRLDRSVWAEIAALATGDEGARPWLRAHADRVTHVECGDAGAPDDIDLPHDLTRITSLHDDAKATTR